MIKRTLTLLLFFIPALIIAQGWRSKPMALSVFNNATMLPPASFTAVFNQPLHPGLTASYEFGWKEKAYSKWFQNASIGFFRQRYVYQALLLYSQAGYRRYLGHLSVEGSLHMGYMHAFLLTDRAVKKDDGTYEYRRGFGKPQFITGAGIGLGYNLGKGESGRRIIFNYDVRLQMPFVKSYVTLLPNGIVSAGMQFTIE